MSASHVLVAVSALLLAAAHLWPRVAYRASLIFSVFLFAVHAIHIAQMLGEIMPLLSVWRGSGPFISPAGAQPTAGHCAAGSGPLPAVSGAYVFGLGWSGGDTAGGESRHAWGAEERLLFTDFFEPTLSFVRGFAILVLPVSPRWRVLSVLLVVCKQMVTSLLRVLSMDHMPAVVAVLLRDSSMTLLGVAV
eukprot:scaffold8155_cov111-Isochrysis_galbana.AAC.3